MVSSGTATSRECSPVTRHLILLISLSSADYHHAWDLFRSRCRSAPLDWCSWMYQPVRTWWCSSNPLPCCWQCQNRSTLVAHWPSGSWQASDPSVWHCSDVYNWLLAAFDRVCSSGYIAANLWWSPAVSCSNHNRPSPSPYKAWIPRAEVD